MTSSAYGAAGSLAAVLIWVYYSAHILFFGAEFTQVHARQKEGVVKPTEVAVPITEERRAQQGIVRQHDLETSTQGASMLAEKRGAVYGEFVPKPRVLLAPISRDQQTDLVALETAPLRRAAGL